MTTIHYILLSAVFVFTLGGFWATMHFARSLFKAYIEYQNQTFWEEQQ